MSRDAAHQAPRPWDSPGKSTGVGCHFLLQCMKDSSATPSFPSQPEGKIGQRKRCRDPRCSPRGNPASRGNFGGRTKAVRDMAGIRRVFQLLVEDIMEEVEVLADEEQQQGSSQDLEEKRTTEDEMAGWHH